MLRKIYSGTNVYCDVITDGAVYYLVVLCAGIAWTHVGITLRTEEIDEFKKDANAAERIARQMCFDFSLFRDRAIPESLHAALLAVK